MTSTQVSSEEGAAAPEGTWKETIFGCSMLAIVVGGIFGLVAWIVHIVDHPKSPSPEAQTAFDKRWDELEATRDERLHAAAERGRAEARKTIEGARRREPYEFSAALFSLTALNQDSRALRRRFADHLDAALKEPCARNDDTYGLHFDRRGPFGWSLTKLGAGSPTGSGPRPGMFGYYPVTWIFSTGLEGVSDGPEELIQILDAHAAALGGANVVLWDRFFGCPLALAMLEGNE